MDRHLDATVPACPMCDGPCQEDFPRSPYQFPGNLPRAADSAQDGDGVVVVARFNRRGRRAQKPSQDRMHRLQHDRAHQPDEDRTA